MKHEYEVLKSDTIEYSSPLKLVKSWQVHEKIERISGTTHLSSFYNNEFC